MRLQLSPGRTMPIVGERRRNRWMGRRHMGRHELAAMVLAIGLLAPGLAQARFTFQAGDNIYADGQWFTAAEYEEYKKTYPQSPPKPPPVNPGPYAYPYPPQP